MRHKSSPLPKDAKSAIARFFDGDRLVAMARAGFGSFGEGREFGHTHGAVPDDGGGVGDLGGEELDGFRSDVEGHLVFGEGGVAGEELGLGVGGELVGEAVVDGEKEFHLALVGLFALRLGRRRSCRVR